MSATPQDGHFTAPDRQLVEEDRIRLTSVGVDIGSSTSHLIFSRLELERQDNRYVTVSRIALFESEILLTPYLDETTINGEALGDFIEEQYRRAGLQRDDVDTGAIILTGVALVRKNARAIGDLFSQEAGKFVAVSAGDNLEATMAAYGSGAVALSREQHSTVLNVDIGGGTTKLVIAQDGIIHELAAMDVGARLVVCDTDGIVVRLEEAGRRVARAVGFDLELGHPAAPPQLQGMAVYMADQLFLAIRDGAPLPLSPELMRTSPLTQQGEIDAITFSGGVSEYIFERETERFDDLGTLLASEIRSRVMLWNIPVLETSAGIRATVIGASQYTVQVSGSTIYLSPLDIVPIRNVPVIAPHLLLGEEAIDANLVQDRVRAALTRFDLLDAESAVALAMHWEGSATYSRIDAFCSGVVAGLKENLERGNPLVLVFDGDIGGLLGIHVKDEMRLPIPVISIDGIDLREFDFVDIGALIPASGAVPVVIKSLVFPTASRA